MKAGWVSGALGDVCSTGAGGTPSKSVKAYYENGDIPWVLSGEVAKGEIVQTSQKITRAGLAGSSAKVFPVDTVLVAMYGATAGQTGILRIEAATNQAVCGIFPNKHIMSKYIYYFIQSVKDGLISQATGNAQPNISQQKIRALQISYPKVAEQRRIVGILDEAFAGLEAMRANAERNFSNANELFEAELNFGLIEASRGSPQQQLGDVCGITSALVDPKRAEFENLLHVGGGNMVSNTGELVALQTAREEGLISGKFAFDRRMVLYSKIRPYLRKVALPDFAGICSADVYPLLPHEGKLTREFLFYVLLSRTFTDFANSVSARAGMPKVNRDDLFRYEFRVPSVEKQAKLVSRLTELRERATMLTDIFKKKLTALDELKKSLLHQAFSGNL